MSDLVFGIAGGGSGSGSPTGAAGGDLSGTYPSPTVQRLSGTNGNVMIDPTTGLPLFVAGAASLGAVQTNVSTQYISGNNTRGYVRVVTSGAIAGFTPIVIVNLSTTLPAGAVVLIVPMQTSNAQYGDSVPANNNPPNAAFAVLTQAANTPFSSFQIRCASGISGVSNYAWYYVIVA